MGEKGDEKEGVNGDKIGDVEVDVDEETIGDEKEGVKADKVVGEKESGESVLNMTTTSAETRNKQIALAIVAILILSGLATWVVFLWTSDEDGDDKEPDPYHDATVLGGEWFLNNQDESFLFYEYFPFDKEHSDTHHSLREMGALWSITMLAEYLGDSRYDTLSRRGFAHFENSFNESEDGDFIYVNIVPSKIKLGYSAFAILSLLSMEHEEKDELLDALARGILSLQNEDGSYDTFFYSDLDTGVDYYPGEAMFALMMLYQYGGNQSYLDSVESAFPFYVDYWRNNTNTAFVPWQTRAYYYLFQETRQGVVSDFIFEMNDYILEQYFPNGTNCSEFKFQNSVVAVHMEGVIKAYQIAEELGDEGRMECYRNFTREGADFMLTLQITDTANIFEPAAVGGFLANEDSESMRVDRNQHAVVAMIDAHEAGLLP